VYPFERFSDGAKQVLILAQEEAERAHHPYIGTEHILLGLLRVPNGVAAVILIGHSVEIETVRTKMAAAVDSGKPNIIRQIIPTSRVKKVIELGFTEARAMGDEEVGTELLLLGLLLEGEGIAAHILRDLGVSLESVRAQLSQMPPRPARRQSESSQRQVSRQPASRGSAVFADDVTQALALAEGRGEAAGTEHLLLALAQVDGARAREILEQHGLDSLAIETILDGPAAPGLSSPGGDARPPA